MYAEGRGVPQDSKEAVKWYRKAAAQGDAGAQFSLGVIYATGEGTPQDIIRAFMWFSVAEAASSDDVGKRAMKNRDYVALQMTAAQIEKAHKMTRRCQDTKFNECG